jgi:predicted porin
MKAIKFSVAAAAALAVSAFAADGDVLKPYGLISGEVGSYFDSTAKGENRIGVRSYASRFGLKGAHTLDGGLTAVYQLEAGFNGVNDSNGIPSVRAQDDGAITKGNGNNNLASRNTFVGVAGGFGTFVIGNHDTPYKIVARGAGAVSSGDTVADLHLNVDRRLQGAIAYIAPAEALGGVTVAAAVVPVKGEKGTPSKANDGFHYSLGVLAPIGDIGLTVGAAYESAFVPVANDTIDSFFVAANFKQDIFSVGLAFENTSVGKKIAGKDAAYNTFLLPVSVSLGDGLFVNAAYKLTQFDKFKDAATIPASVVTAFEKTSLSNGVAIDPDETVNQFSVSAGKNWGKDLTAYVGVKNTSAKDKIYGNKKGGTDFGIGLKVAFN